MIVTGSTALAIELSAARRRIEELEGLIRQELFVGDGKYDAAWRERDKACENPHMDGFSWECGWDAALMFVLNALQPTLQEGKAT